MVEDFIKMRGHVSYNILITNEISHSTESGGAHEMNIEDIEKRNFPCQMPQFFRIHVKL